VNRHCAGRIGFDEASASPRGGAERSIEVCDKHHASDRGGLVGDDAWSQVSPRLVPMYDADARGGRVQTSL